MIGFWEEYQAKKISIEDSITLIKPGMRIFLEEGPTEPVEIIEGLVNNASRFYDLQLMMSPVPFINKVPFMDERYKDHWSIISFFCSRKGTANGMVEYIPAHNSEVSTIIQNTLVPDVAIISVSPPDSSGFCNLGVHVNAVPAAIEAAKIVIAQVNNKIPVTCGSSGIHISEIDYFVECDRDLLEFPQKGPSDIDKIIGEQIVQMIPDGSTLQIGIGGVPDAILDLLGNKNDLGIHSGLISNKVMDLMKAGVITNKKKKIHQRKVVATSMLGTHELYDFSNRNPNIELYPASYINNIYLAKEIDHFISINSAIEIDLTGQINAESVNGKVIAGIGGQQDFIRMANLSNGGKSILALPSTNRGKSKIIPFLPQGTPSSTPRVDVDMVVTEYGVADLRHQSLKERARRLASIAHPDFRSDLLKAAEGNFIFN